MTKDTKDIYKFIFNIDKEDKKNFKAACAKNDLSMSYVLNNLIKDYVIKHQK